MKECKTNTDSLSVFFFLIKKVFKLLSKDDEMAMTGFVCSGYYPPTTIYFDTFIIVATNTTLLGGTYSSRVKLVIDIYRHLLREFYKCRGRDS